MTVGSGAINHVFLNGLWHHMNLNFIGGTLGVLALVAILSINGCHRTVTPAKVTAHVQTPAVAPAQAAAKAAKPVNPPAAKPTNGPVKKLGKHRLYRVLPGGKTDGVIDCARVKSFAEGKTPAQLAALAAKYHVSKDQLSKYETCLN